VLSRKAVLKFDEVGYWSEIKLDIVREYATAYSHNLSAQVRPKFCHIYIDAFAGPGVHISRTSEGFILGSPLNALLVDPPFCEYHLVDIDRKKIAVLKSMVKGRANVFVYEGDCNEKLLGEIFPKVRYKDYRRGLCLLDPYGLHLQWEVIRKAGELKTIDLFLNFPIADINRNVLRKDPRQINPAQALRMNAFWGDDSWKSVAYTSKPTLFGDIGEKVTNERLAEAFRERLKGAGFKDVPNPLPMKNSRGAIVYYLFFASQKAVAAHIIRHIFNKYRERVAR
jgi:three-Cys-motif partner protein